jgi:hypothetical protein
MLPTLQQETVSELEKAARELHLKTGAEVIDISQRLMGTAGSAPPTQKLDDTNFKDFIVLVA